VALALVVLVAGCSEAPVNEYESSKATVENARTAEAEQYAPELLKIAVDTLNAAAAEMQKQDGRFSVLRSYGKSKEMFASAQRLADEAKAAAATEKENVRLQNVALIADVESLIKETRDSLTTAPKGKGTAVDLKVMQAEVDAAESALTNAKAKFEAGDYLAARDELTAIKSQVGQVKGEIEAAIARLRKK
jgi:hypothetical protein